MRVRQDKGAVVTGGASGIGAATARRLAAEGAHVVVLDLNESAGTAVAEEARGSFVRCDVTDSAGVAEAFRQAEEHLGRIDVVHLNAGVTTGRREVEELTDEEYRRILSVNLDGVVFGAREAIRALDRGG